MSLSTSDVRVSLFLDDICHSLIHSTCTHSGLWGFGRNKGVLGFLGGALFCFPFNYRVLSIAKFGANGIPGGQTALILSSLALGLAGAFADLSRTDSCIDNAEKGVWCTGSSFSCG